MVKLRLAAEVLPYLPSMVFTYIQSVEDPLRTVLRVLTLRSGGSVSVGLKRGGRLPVQRSEFLMLLYTLYALKSTGASVEEISEDGLVRLRWRGYWLRAVGLGQLFGLASSLHVANAIYERALREIRLGSGVVLDVGAFLGESALLFLLHGAERVIAIEPFPKNFKILLQVIQENSLEGSVIPVHAALSLRDDEISLRYDGKSLPHSFGLLAGDESLKIQSVNLERLIQEHSPSLVKMNCEGCESILPNCPADVIGLVPNWIIQIHGTELLREIPRLFEGLGFSALLLSRRVSFREGIELATYLFRKNENG